jgi:hypothetical protein
MPSQELQWMAVPYDVEERNGETFLSVAICMTPRLQDVSTADRKLSDYPDFVDWPQRLQAVTIGLDIDGTVVDAADLTPKDDAADSDVWKAVFQPTTLVRPFEYKPFTNYKIMSFPVKNVMQTIDDTYQTLLKTFDGEPPKMTFGDVQLQDQKSSFVQKPKLLQILADVTPNSDSTARIKTLKTAWQKAAQASMTSKLRNASSKIVKQVKGIEYQPISAPKSAESMMYQPIDPQSALGSLEAVDVFQVARSIAVDKIIGEKRQMRVERAKVPRPQFDFHQVVSVMREYPIMLRKLGLVKHVEFKLPNGMAGNGKIRAKVTWTNTGTTTKTVTPWVAYQLKTSGNPQFWQFLPRPDSNSEILGAVLCLNDANNYDVIQIDVDTVAVKTLNYTRTLDSRYKKTAGTRDADTAAEPPSIRGTGLQIIKVNRGLKLAKVLLRSVTNWNLVVANQPVTLYADDVTRGYRIDVFDNVANNWQSLMRRNAKYTFPLASGSLKTTGISVQDEEGVLTLTATRSPDSDDDASQQQLYAHETIAQWEGWSLVVPMIGQHIGVDDELAPGNKKQSPPADFEYQVETEVTLVPGTLPRLRFGRSYRFRARTVDIAGNGPKYDQLDPSDVSCATDLVRYLRWDPIVSPTLALRNHPIEGESMEKMVIRNYNADDDDSVEVPTTETAQRHLFPPLSSQQLAERHGMFDQSPVGPMKGDGGTYTMITGKEASLPTRYYTRNADGDLVPEAMPNTPPADPDKARLALQYPLIESGATEAPYLPDPLARTVTLKDVPGMTPGQHLRITTGGNTMATIASAGGVVTIEYGQMTSWPSFSSIMLKLVEGDAAPAWDAVSRTLTVALQKGEQAWIKFSSGLGAEDGEANDNLGLHGQKAALQKSGANAGQLKAASYGLSWLISPARTLNLVHATQKPLKKPKVNSASVIERGFGYTRAKIDLPNTYVHGKTTQKVDMFAEWPMWVDNLNKPAPELLQQSAYFYEQHVEDRLSDILKNQKSQEFGDTKYRGVTYAPLATSRFREHMPPAIRKDSSLITRKGTGKLVDVLSSKRPDSVKLLYIVPSFRWVEPERVFDGTMIRSTRKGGGLRVYMERPWFSSGNGELLGIVLYSTEKFTPSSGGGKGGIKGFQAPSKSPGSGVGTMDMQMFGDILASGKVEIPEQLQPYVTQWGLDPIWLSAPTPSDNAPRVQNFRKPSVVLNNISIEEVTHTQRFSVVGYEPHYDEERQLWYADLEMDPGHSYYPFVRLALCRLQPKSLADPQTGKDVYVSRISQSEFCQLSPDREATVRVEADRKSITIQVVGHTYRTNSAGQLGSEMEVTIEKRDVGAGSADLGWTPIVTQRLDRLPAADMWGGMIVLKDSIDTANVRVIVKELEQFYSDPLPPAQRQTSLGNQKTGAGEIKLELDRRIVYADVLPLY